MKRSDLVNSLMLLKADYQSDLGETVEADETRVAASALGTESDARPGRVESPVDVVGGDVREPGLQDRGKKWRLKSRQRVKREVDLARASEQEQATIREAQERVAHEFALVEAQFQRQQLEARISELRDFERDYRRALREHLMGLLEAAPDEWMRERITAALARLDDPNAPVFAWLPA
ncbi:hypothetical protein [Microbacterium sp. CPCC 204701]|uniref:hypothetical protein n=1 Tax=Microbacterium sp. CPCC 204701 TaxID=2493084 RepID=UPI000FDBDC99|nr:hypothetical protein [Microbacterium sp. CPCC 204701]